jgi:hypothetical protein
MNFLRTLLCASLLLSGVSFAADTKGPENVTFGPFSTGNWRSDDFKGTAYRQWDDAGDSFRYVWKTEKGDQIGRIGVSYGSNYLGAKISDVKPGTIMSTDAVYRTDDNHWFYWSIYGWTNKDYTYWGNAQGGKGWDVEFYVIQYTEKPRSEFLKDKGCEDMGSVTVNGVAYDCYKTKFENSTQWLAVRRDRTWSGSVDLKPIFDYWRSKGLGDEYIVDLGWALEGFGGSTGTLQLTNIKIPNLAAGANPH